MYSSPRSSAFAAALVFFGFSYCYFFPNRLNVFLKKLLKNGKFQGLNPFRKNDKKNCKEQFSNLCCENNETHLEETDDVEDALYIHSKHTSVTPLEHNEGIVMQRVVISDGPRRPIGESSIADDTVNPIIPGSQLVYIKTFGCSHNNSDSEVMMGLLQSYGYRFTKHVEDACICLINSCTVKNPSQDALLTSVNRALSLGKPVVVAGCVPQADRHLKGLENVSVIGTTQIARVVEVVEETLRGNIVRLLAKAELPSLDIPKVRRNQLIEIIPISSGCLGACTYCKTKQARGHLGSYQPDAIMHRIRTAASEGVQQIWLTSEDLGAYGLDIETNIAKLLLQCLNVLEDIEVVTKKRIMLRIGMTNPPYMETHVKDIAKALNHRNAFKFIHIPVQSGSTKVLKDMVRDYTITQFTNLVRILVKEVPHITVATDIICGFPTESDEDHKETVSLIKDYKFPIVNISQFYPRPGTPAARMKRVPTKIVKQRSSEVSICFRDYSCTDFLLGSFQRVWFSENQPSLSQTIGHTIHYIKVIVPLDASLIGTSQWVQILTTSKWHVEAEICHPTIKDIHLIDEIYPETTTYNELFKNIQNLSSDSHSKQIGTYDSDCLIRDVSSLKSTIDESSTLILSNGIADTTQLQA